MTIKRDKTEGEKQGKEVKQHQSDLKGKGGGHLNLCVKEIKRRNFNVGKMAQSAGSFLSGTVNC